MLAMRCIEPFHHRFSPQPGRQQGPRYRIHLSQPAFAQHEQVYSSVSVLPREWTPCERVAAPVDRLSLGILHR
jgi:hypothetical protein